MSDELFKNPNFLYTLFDSIPSMLFVVDADVRVMHLNAAAKKANNGDKPFKFLDRGGHVWKCINTVKEHKTCGTMAACGHCTIRKTVRGATRGGAVYRQTAEMEIVEDHGQRKAHVLVTASPFIHANQPLILLILEDISDLKKSEEKLMQLNELLERQAATDHLTGIYNRLRFNEFLAREIDEARRYGDALSLAMFDIDHFKQVNDVYGHAAGDAVLREVAGLIAGSIRKNDVFARWGGEEFMILSSHTDRDHMYGIAEKLRQIIASTRFTGPQQITCSFGVTQLDSNDTIESFTGRVDEGLYQAKSTGRNKVVVL